MNYFSLNIKETRPTMNKVFSAFVGLVTSLCVMAKINIPFVSWFTNVHTSDIVLFMVSGAKGAFVAVLNWYVVERISSKYKKWRNRKRK